MPISPRAAILLTFGAFGAVVGSHVGAMPSLIERSGVSPLVFGIAGAAGMLTNIIAMSLGGIVNRHADHRSVLLIMLPVMYGGLWFALLVGTPVTFVASFLLLSFTLGATDLFMNAEGSVIEQELGRPVFSSYHGLASLGIALFAIIGSVISVTIAPWFCALVTAIPMALAWAAIFTAIPVRHVKHQVEQPKPAVLPRRILTFIGVAAGCNVACEVAAIQWAGQLLAAVAPDLAAYSGLGVAFYGLCGGTMRMFGDRLRAAYGDKQVMMVSILTAVAGFACLGLTPGFALSVVAFAAVGFGLSTTFPCLFSLAGRLVPEGRASAMGFVAAVGGAPRVILPWVLGWLAAEFALGAVFAACAFVAAVALAIIVMTFARAEAQLQA